MLSFLIGESGQRLVLVPEVLQHFKQHRQTRWWQREAGGQLFAHFERGEVRIVEATGPRASDRRSRAGYEPDRRAEQAEIESRFLRHLHFVGDWHTHPEARPRPSSLDTRSTAEGVRLSTHELNGFVLIIVGTGDFPDSLHVSVNDGFTSYVLNPDPSRS